MKRCVALIMSAVMLMAVSTGTHRVVRHSPALEFSYAWPAEAVAIPALDLRLYTQAKKALAEAQANAREDQNLAREQKRDMMPHDFSMAWETAGQTMRLLSLEGSFGEFTGGAHPNHGSSGLLWDRKLDHEIAVVALFSTGAQFAGLTRPDYCQRLNAERAERREGEKLGGDFDQCPKYSDLAIVPSDKNHNGRFDRIRFIASPYVAGPYVEGDYEITLPVTAKLIAALKPEYRLSFEAQRQ